MRARIELNGRILSALELGFLVLLVVRSFTEAFSELALYLGPLTLNVSSGAVLLMDLLGGLYLGVLWLRKRWAVDRLGLIFLGWVLSLGPWVYLAASQWGVTGLTGVREWIRLLSLVLLYLVIYTIARRRGHERVINACLLALPVPLALTFYQFVVAPEDRAFGAMVHPNNLAAFLVVMSALVIWKLVRPEQSTRRRFLWTGLLGVLLIALIVPISSNAWLMFFVFLATFLLLSRERSLRVAGGVAAALFLALFILFFAAEHVRVQSELWQALALMGADSPGGTGSIGTRFEIWNELINVWRQQPLKGYGLNATPLVNPIVGKYAHNDFVRYLVEAGVFGLLLFVLFQAAAGRELLRLRREASAPHARLLIRIGLGIFLAWVVGSVGDNLISHTVFQVYFWSLLAVVVAAVEGQHAEVREGSGDPGGLWSTDPSVQHAVVSPSLTSPRAPSDRLRPAKSVAQVPGEDRPICRRCQTKALTSGALVCTRCFSLLVPRLSLLLLGFLTAMIIGLMGFYLWNQGAGLETFYLGWLLWFILLFVVLRNEKWRYCYGLLAAMLAGVATVPRLYPLEGQSFHPVSWMAIFGLFGLGLYGLIRSWWDTTRAGRWSGWQLAPMGLIYLGLLGWGMRLAPKSLHEGIGNGLRLPEEEVLWGLRQRYLEGAGLPIPLPELLVGLAALSLIVAIGARVCRPETTGTVQRLHRRIIDEVLRLGQASIGMGLHFLRCYLLPIGALLAAAYILDYVLRQVSAFLYETPVALGHVAAGLVALFTLAWLLVYGLTRRGLEATLVDLGMTYVVMLLLIQVCVWISTAALWALAKLLPLYPITQGFAPLLLERPVGLYTWISLGVFMAFIAGWVALRKRLRYHPLS